MLFISHFWKALSCWYGLCASVIGFNPRRLKAPQRDELPQQQICAVCVEIVFFRWAISSGVVAAKRLGQKVAIFRRTPANFRQRQITGGQNFTFPHTFLPTMLYFGIKFSDWLKFRRIVSPVPTCPDATGYFPVVHVTAPALHGITQCERDDWRTSNCKTPIRCICIRCIPLCSL